MNKSPNWKQPMPIKSSDKLTLACHLVKYSIAMKINEL